MEQGTISFYSMVAACVSAAAAIVGIVLHMTTARINMKEKLHVECGLYKFSSQFDFKNEYLYFSITCKEKEWFIISKIYIALPLHSIFKFKLYDISPYVFPQFSLPHRLEPGAEMFTSLNADKMKALFAGRHNALPKPLMYLLRVYIVTISGDKYVKYISGDVRDYMRALQVEY